MNKISGLLFLTVSVFISCGTNKNLRVAQAEIQTLNNQVFRLTNETGSLNAKISEIRDQSVQLMDENRQFKMDLESCRNTRETAEKKFDNMNNILDGHNKTLQDIRLKAIRQLQAIHESGIEVAYRGGLLYISMQDEFMFGSGSIKINEDGKQALAVIAGILNENPHLTAIVVGNTDSAVVNILYKDNWSLSTERANTIVRILQNTYGADPARLISAGKGPYHPVALNATSAGMAKNRRIDIIINPDYNSLWQLSQKYP